MQGQRNISHTISESFELEIESSRSNMNPEPNVYPRNRTNVSATPNMQGYINSANATSFLFGNAVSHGGSFYVHDRMMAGAGNAEHGSRICTAEDKAIGGWNIVSNMTPALRLDDGRLVDTNGLPSEGANVNVLNYGFASDGIPNNISRASVGSFYSHPTLHIGSEAERVPPLSGSGIHSSTEYNYGTTNHINDGGRRSCKRKSIEGISGRSFYDGDPHPVNWDGSSSSRFAVPVRHDIGSASFSGLGATPSGVRHLMSGASMASDYRVNALSIVDAAEGHPRNVRSRCNTAHQQEPVMPHLRPSGNPSWYLQPRSLSLVEQSVNSDPAGASSILREPSQFPLSSGFRRRNLASGGWNENVLRAGSHFGSNAVGRERPSSLHDESSLNCTTMGAPNQGWPVSGVDNRTSNNDLTNWAPVNRNTSGIAHTAQICPSLMLNPRPTMPWHSSQNLHMQTGRGNPGAAQASVSSSRLGQSNHFPRPLGGSAPFAAPVDMALPPAAGLQGPHYLRSALMDHHGDRNIRPFVRSILDLSIERFQPLPNEGDGRNRIMAELILCFLHSDWNYNTSIGNFSFVVPVKTLCMAEGLALHAQLEYILHESSRLGFLFSGISWHVRCISGRFFQRIMISFHIWNGYSTLIMSVLELVHRGDNLRFEDVLMLDRSAFYAAADLHDQHRDMRLDVDNMSYEELLALEERIGNVSTGLTEESISKCLKKKTYSSCTDPSAADEISQKCSICQEEYEEGDDVGMLECGHNHHTDCIKKWLLQKNECPICKAAAFNT